MQSINDITTQSQDEPEIWSPEFVAALVAEFGTAEAMRIAGRSLGQAASLGVDHDGLFPCLAMVANLCLLLMEGGSNSAVH